MATNRNYIDEFTSKNTERVQYFLGLKDFMNYLRNLAPYNKATRRELKIDLNKYIARNFPYSVKYGIISSICDEEKFLTFIMDPKNVKELINKAQDCYEKYARYISFEKNNTPEENTKIMKRIENGKIDIKNTIIHFVNKYAEKIELQKIELALKDLSIQLQKANNSGGYLNYFESEHLLHIALNLLNDGNKIQAKLEEKALRERNSRIGHYNTKEKDYYINHHDDHDNFKNILSNYYERIKSSPIESKYIRAKNSCKFISDGLDEIADHLKNSLTSTLAHTNTHARQSRRRAPAAPLCSPNLVQTLYSMLMQFHSPDVRKELRNRLTLNHIMSKENLELLDTCLNAVSSPANSNKYHEWLARRLAWKTHDLQGLYLFLCQRSAIGSNIIKLRPNPIEQSIKSLIPIDLFLLIVSFLFKKEHVMGERKERKIVEIEKRKIEEWKTLQLDPIQALCFFSSFVINNDLPLSMNILSIIGVYTLDEKDFSKKEKHVQKLFDPQKKLIENKYFSTPSSISHNFFRFEKEEYKKKLISFKGSLSKYRHPNRRIKINQLISFVDNATSENDINGFISKNFRPGIHSYLQFPRPK